jgi:hypothetical protein
MAKEKGGRVERWRGTRGRSYARSGQERSKGRAEAPEAGGARPEAQNGVAGLREGSGGGTGASCLPSSLG